MKNKRTVIIIIAAAVLATVSAAIVTVTVAKQTRRDAVYEAYAAACERAADDIREYKSTGDETYYSYLIGEMNALVRLPDVLDDADDPLADSLLTTRRSICLDDLIRKADIAKQNLDLLIEALESFAAQDNYPLGNHLTRLTEFDNSCEK